MPVSKSKRNTARPARAGTSKFDDRQLLGEAAAKGLDSDAAIAELRQSGQDVSLDRFEKAQDLVYDAWDLPHGSRRLDLATRALQEYPWCGDAYGLLAQDAPPASDIAVHRWRMAVAAAEFALKAEIGEDVFETHVGDFWGIFETRPYMRARIGLSNALWDLGDREAAVVEAELDTEAAIADLKTAGKAFRPATLEAAEQLILQALRSHDPQRQLDLALKAFELCPWCADAYGVLAMRAQGHPRMALHFRRIALAAAEFALDADWGEDLREAYSENYWGHAATRAYMRARAGLAQTLADGGALAEAVNHLETLLRFNPNGEQGLRYPLAEHLLMLGRDARLVELLMEFTEEESAFVGFNFSLVAFRVGGDTKESRVVPDAAIAMNPHVAPYLLGRRTLRPASTEVYEPGSEDEAMLYVECTAEAWRSTQGALDWLRKNTTGKY